MTHVMIIVYLNRSAFRVCRTMVLVQQTTRAIVYQHGAVQRALQMSTSAFNLHQV